MAQASVSVAGAAASAGSAAAASAAGASTSSWRGRGRGLSGLDHVVLARASGARAVGAGTAARTRRTAAGQLDLALGLGAGHDVALVDPDLHADPAEGGAGLVEAVVDVGAQRVQGHPALAVELAAAHLGAAEAARALHPDALGAGLHRRLHALAHGAPERHAAAELLGDALGDELGVGLGVLDLEDVQLHLLAGELLEVAADAVGLGAAAADDDAGARGVDVDADAVTRALDLHAADAGALHALGHHPADGDVFLDVVLVQLVGVPTALEVRGDTEAEPMRVDLLAH
jgi:hypothetical protein